MITWKAIPFAQLTNHELYQLLKLRVDVFVVEQTCPYPELDDKDTLDGVMHLLGYQQNQFNNTLLLFISNMALCKHQQCT